MSANRAVETIMEKNPDTTTAELIAALKKRKIEATDTSVAWRRSIVVRFGSIAKYTQGKRAAPKDPKKKGESKAQRARRVATVTAHAH
jgi:hypothetical protein